MENPLHPAVVHFPIAFLLLSVIFFTLELFTRKDNHRIFGMILLVAGLVGAALAVLTGNNAHGDMITPHDMHELVEEHELQGYIVLWAFGILTVWAYLRRKSKIRFEKIAFVVIFWIGFLFVGLTAQHGGEIVYKYGGGVKPMEERLEKQFKEEQLNGGKPLDSDHDSHE